MERTILYFLLFNYRLIASLYTVNIFSTDLFFSHKLKIFHSIVVFVFNLIMAFTVEVFLFESEAKKNKHGWEQDVYSLFNQTQVNLC